MSNVLVDREVLERCVDRWACCAIVETPGAEQAWLELRAVVKAAQPAEAEGVERWSELKRRAEYCLQMREGEWPAEESAENERIDASSAEAFIAATTPTVVLELIAALSAVTAERDKIKADRKTCWEEFKALVKSSCEKESYLQGEIDQLRAEVERLREAAYPAQNVDCINTPEQQPLLPTAGDLEAVLDECEAFRDLSDVAHGWYEALECMSRFKKEDMK